MVYIYVGHRWYTLRVLASDLVKTNNLASRGVQILSHLMIKISDMGTDWDNGRTITADVYHSSPDMICGRAFITNFAGFALNYASFCVPGYFAGGDAANLMRSPQIINAHLD